jgi:hypothetical protein
MTTESTTIEPTQHDRLIELLQLCEDFIAHASPATHAELDAFLRGRDNHGGPAYLIDMLAFTHDQLSHQHQH